MDFVVKALFDAGKESKLPKKFLRMLLLLAMAVGFCVAGFLTGWQVRNTYWDPLYVGWCIAFSVMSCACFVSLFVQVLEL